MPLEVAYCLMILFAAAFGGAIGSFLNVVVYRLPNGLSLISPPSHCPNCKEPIRWYDNVPVFGWIMLGGKCRNCGCRISIRYPLVEAITTAMFAALVAVEGPLLATDYRITYPYHLLLLCTLLCSALIEIDGNRPPLRLFVPAIVVGIATPLVWPIWQPAFFREGVAAASLFDVVAGLMSGVALSLVVGLVGLAWRRSHAQDAADVRFSLVGLEYGLICIGAFLGWSSLGVIAAAALAVHGLLLLSGRRHARIRVPPSVWLLIAAITWLLVS
jgi:leader peptidase (prepilin peptidase) / N-methyltransferase